MNKRATKNMINPIVGNTYFSIGFVAVFFGCETPLHEGTFNQGAPQSLSFDINDASEKCTNNPPKGTFPRSLLKEKFKYLRCESASKHMRISPDKLLLERSKNSKLTNAPKDSGIEPSNRLSAKERLAISLKPPIVVGIPPDS
jgi:hypothetical protein